MKINWLDPVKIEWSDGKIYNRQPCTIYARPMWYIAPVQNFNKGKLSEFKERVYFKEDKVDNSPFLRRWTTTQDLAK